MKTYTVELPITGKAFIEVEAESEQEAIEKAINECALDNIEKWNPHKIVCEGNIFHGMLNEASVEEES